MTLQNGGWNEAEPKTLQRMVIWWFASGLKDQADLSLMKIHWHVESPVLQASMSSADDIYFSLLLVLAEKHEHYYKSM